VKENRHRVYRSFPKSWDQFFAMDCHFVRHHRYQSQMWPVYGSLIGWTARVAYPPHIADGTLRDTNILCVRMASTSPDIFS
jgi:hypothetical protein